MKVQNFIKFLQELVTLIEAREAKEYDAVKWVRNNPIASRDKNLR